MTSQPSQSVHLYAGKSTTFAFFTKMAHIICKSTFSPFFFHFWLIILSDTGLYVTYPGLSPSLSSPPLPLRPLLGAVVIRWWGVALISSAGGSVVALLKDDSASNAGLRFTNLGSAREIHPLDRGGFYLPTTPSSSMCTPSSPFYPPPETLYHRDDALLYIAYVILIWAAPIPADRWHCSLWP